MADRRSQVKRACVQTGLFVHTRVRSPRVLLRAGGIYERTRSNGVVRLFPKRRRKRERFENVRRNVELPEKNSEKNRAKPLQ